MLHTPLDKQFTARKLEIDPITCDFQVRLNELKSGHPYEENPLAFKYGDFEYPLLEQLERYVLSKFKLGTRGKEYIFEDEAPAGGGLVDDELFIEYPLINMFNKTSGTMLDLGTLVYLMMRPQSCAAELWAVACPESPYYANTTEAYRNAKMFLPLQWAFQELKKQLRAPSKLAGEYLWIPYMYTCNASVSSSLRRAVTLELLYMLRHISNVDLREHLASHVGSCSIDLDTLSDNPAERLVQICTEVHKSTKVVKGVSSPDFFDLTTGLSRWILNSLRVKQATILYRNIYEILPEDAGYGTVVNPFTEVLKSILDAEAASGGEDVESEESDTKAKAGFSMRADTPLGGKPIEGGGRSTVFVDDGHKHPYGSYVFKVNKAPKATTSGLAIYAKEMSKYSTVLAQFERKLREIRTYNTGGKMPGLDHGKLDRKNMYRYRTTDKIFYNNTYEQREQDLAIGVLLDESGSMSGNGIKNGRAALILMHEVLTNMHINHCIAGHTSSGTRHDVEINPYVWFRESKNYVPQKCTALATIEAKRGNCDSGALYFMEQELLKTKNRDRLCLIFSDGAPTECTNDELIEQVQTMEKHGIKVIGIGVNFPNIAKYYPDNANGSNLVEMLEIVCDILQRYILQKNT